MSLADDSREEVLDFHRFIEGWLSGRLQESEDTYDRARSALAEEFEIISPSGDSRSRDRILADLKGAHGAFGPDFGIEIENVRTRFVTDDACLLTYEEWQYAANETTGRISTATFRRDEEAASGVEWLHLHETWLPDTSTGLTG